MIMGKNLPREKLESKGLNGLTDTDLMAIILGSGVKGIDYMKISRAVVKMLKESRNRLSYRRFEKLKGIGRVKAMKIACSMELGRRLYGNDLKKIIRNREDVLKVVEHLKGKRQEYAVVLFLDARNRLIKEKTVAVGSSNLLVVEPRDVFGIALRIGATSIILVHNHPSGEDSPSKADIAFTERIKKAGDLLGINLIDHVIV